MKRPEHRPLRPASSHPLDIWRELPRKGDRPLPEPPPAAARADCGIRIPPRKRKKLSRFSK